MAAYAVVLVSLGAAYAALVFSDRRLALVFALGALVAAVVSVVLALKR
jgi:hypothetical protein